MTTLGHFRREPRAGAAARRAGASLLLPPLLLLTTLIFAAVAYIVYVLWPRWPADPVALGAPQLPITIAGVAFNVPPAAIRVGVQRRPGALDRVDLAFLWPSLKPADQPAKPPAPTAPPARTLDRLFITIAAAGNAMAPAERVRTIYPRYASMEPTSGPSGLAVLAFREGTPYQGEDLIYDAATPENFLVRCSRNGAGATPGTCLWEERIERADIVVRFPRDWLADWRSIASDIDRLIKNLRPSAGATSAPTGAP
ncbi:MAG TPA: hypothetical protein VIY51_28045 [Xanthobacteraceae bacterium]